MKSKLFTLLFLTLFFLESFGQNQSESNKETYLPSLLLDGRFYLKIHAFTGDTILGFCDTGGGFTAIYPATIAKLKLDGRVMHAGISGDTVKYIPAKEIIDDSSVPLPRIGNYYKDYIQSPFFEVADGAEMVQFLQFIPQDAFLGQFFFIDHAWTFDYLSGKLFVNTPLIKSTDENVQIVGFKKDKDGSKRFGHPRIKIVVEGQSIDVLFDTGASFILSKSGKAELGNNKKSAGGSFIAKSVFDKWHQEHPDWKFIAKGELNGADMIQVPAVKVGRLTAGPVWFSKRPDEAWSKGMIGSMDKVVKGAVGGSFFQYFKIQIDYNSELVKFSK